MNFTDADRIDLGKPNPGWESHPQREKGGIEGLDQLPSTICAAPFGARHGVLGVGFSLDLSRLLTQAGLCPNTYVSNFSS